MARFPLWSHAALNGVYRQGRRLYSWVCAGSRVSAAIVVVAATVLSGCHSRQAGSGPTIEFTQIPPSAEGGRDRQAIISGRVNGARPGQKIVIYARSGPWWVQPWPETPFVTIHPDSTWSTPTHLGYDYAALLVEPSYQPPPTMDSAPGKSEGVDLVTIVKGVGSLPPNPTKPITFSGYDWKVRMTPADRGGLNNLYDADNVYTDNSGALHLKITKKEGRWTCAQLVLGRSLGYGTYLFTVRDTSHLEPAAVVSMHTFDTWGPEQHYREMDIEIGRWGDATAANNAQFGIEPFYVPGNLVRYSEPGGTLTNIMRWESGSASFKTVRGATPGANAPVVAEHTFTTDVPRPGQEHIEMMLYVVASDKSPLQKDAEVVIEKFQYLP